MRSVVAIGGNALLPSRRKGGMEEQSVNIRKVVPSLINLMKKGYDVILTHGNGPQVGNILLQNEEAHGKVPSTPLDVCVAETQGQIGYLLQQALKNEVARRGEGLSVLSIVTQVLVDEKDTAFKNPTKPVGPFYDEKRARDLMRRKGWVMREDEQRGGYRRLVASPKPMRIIELDMIESLIENTEKKIIIAGGGGGIPVISKNGLLQGVDAVIDKDYVASLLAVSLQARLLAMLTDVDKVYLNFGKEDQKGLDAMTLEEAKRNLAQGHFPPGSMGPKIRAAIDFLEAGGEKSVICSLGSLEEALAGAEGTIITGHAPLS